MPPQFHQSLVSPVCHWMVFGTTVFTFIMKIIFVCLHSRSGHVTTGCQDHDPCASPSQMLRLQAWFGSTLGNPLIINVKAYLWASYSAPRVLLRVLRWPDTVTPQLLKLHSVSLTLTVFQDCFTLQSPSSVYLNFRINFIISTKRKNIWNSHRDGI